MKSFKLSLSDLLLHVATSSVVILVVLSCIHLRYHHITGSWAAAAILAGIWVMTIFITLYVYKIAVDVERLVNYECADRQDISR